MANLSAVERERRHRAVASSEGSLAMEGQQLDLETRKLNQRYIDGELSLEQFSEAIDAHVEMMARTLREEAIPVPA